METTEYDRKEFQPSVILYQCIVEQFMDKYKSMQLPGKVNVQIAETVVLVGP